MIIFSEFQPQLAEAAESGPKPVSFGWNWMKRENGGQISFCLGWNLSILAKTGWFPML